MPHRDTGWLRCARRIAVALGRLGPQTLGRRRGLWSSICPDEVIDGTPAIDEINRRYLGDPAFSNLPRKYKTAI